MSEKRYNENNGGYESQSNGSDFVGRGTERAESEKQTRWRACRGGDLGKRCNEPSYGKTGNNKDQIGGTGKHLKALKGMGLGLVDGHCGGDGPWGGESREEKKAQEPDRGVCR